MTMTMDEVRRGFTHNISWAVVSKTFGDYFAL